MKVISCAFVLRGVWTAIYSGCVVASPRPCSRGSLLLPKLLYDLVRGEVARAPGRARVVEAASP